MSFANNKTGAPNTPRTANSSGELKLSQVFFVGIVFKFPYFCVLYCGILFAFLAMLLSVLWLMSHGFLMAHTLV